MSTVHYLEKRGRVHDTEENITADIMRHFHARQYLGKAMVVCDRPDEWLALAEKQWLRLSRTLQRRREAAEGAEQILRHTSTIIHMQQLRMAAQPPDGMAEADVYFVRPQEVRLMPANCLTLYAAAMVPAQLLGKLIELMPATGLVVDYRGQLADGDFGLGPRIDLETKVLMHWRSLESFMNEHQIELTEMSAVYDDAFDDVLDRALGVREEFLHLAIGFQYALNLARPLRTIAKTDRMRYDALLTLAYHVQSLTPGALPAQFLKTYADDSFFLNDVRLGAAGWPEVIARHLQAGRMNLARALMQLAPGLHPSPVRLNLPPLLA